MSEPFRIGGRRNGRSTWLRHLTEAAAAAGEHVHVMGRDGMWCVTCQPAGLLYARIRRPGGEP